MRFLLDENVGKVVAKFLNNLGHSTSRVKEINPGTEDYNVLDLAVSKNSILITSDRDFGQLIFKEKQAHYGIIYLRLKVSTSENKILAIKYLLEHFASILEKSFLVVKENEGKFKVRMR